VAAVARYILDKSAIARIRYPEVFAVVGSRIEAGLVATCAMVEFEILWSTRSVAEFNEVRMDRRQAYEWLPMEDQHWSRALDVQQQLWATGQLRTVPLPDLLIAAVAEQHRLIVIHYDADYERIAAITQQPVEWVVPRGSVP
jgi:predicted nucleic acid-binding protein